MNSHINITKVFFVHSSITELITKAIIEDKKIRNYKIIHSKRYEPRIFKNYDIISKKIYINTKSKRKSTFKTLKLIYNISRITNFGRYYFYTPQVEAPVLHMLANYHKCDKVFHIEEGTGSYLRPSEMAERRGIKRPSLLEKLLNIGLIQDRVFFSDKYDGVFCFHNSAFPGFQNKNVLNMRSALEEIYLGEEQNYSGHAIFAFDSSTAVGSLDRQDVFDSVRSIVARCGDRPISYKLHPEQIGRDDEQFRSFFDAEIPNSREIGQNISVEAVMYRSHDSILFVNCSSLGMYAGMVGEKAYSFSKDLAKKNSKLESKIEEMPNVYWKYVESSLNVDCF